MNRSVRRIARPWALAVAAAVSVSLDPAPARADFLSPNDEVVEFMMETQGADMNFLVRLFAPSQPVTLAFTSLTDPANLRFSYQTVSGSTYQGLPISIVSSGQYNAADDRWHLTSSTTLGSFEWTSVGVGQVIGDPMLPLDFEMKPPPRPWVDFTLDYHPLVTVTYERTRDAAYMVSRGINQNTIKDEFGERVTSTSTSRDLYEIDGPDRGRWTWDSTVEGKRIESRGFSPVGGGPGTFTSHLQTVPAPPGVLLGGFGGLCLFAGRLGRRLIAGPRTPPSA